MRPGHRRMTAIAEPETPITCITVEDMTMPGVHDGRPASRSTTLQTSRTQPDELSISLRKGDAVLVVGVIRTHTWEDNDTGQTRSRNIITAHNVAVSLKYATATIHAAQRRSDTDPAPDTQSMQDSAPVAQLSGSRTGSEQ